MLELKNISKIYHTRGFSQKALDGVSISFRENEFVSILGQSGGGKTTLLNVIGGLMRYDEGDLIIDGRSTRKFTDKDWDFYRNVRIGFIFQSYNLISHQSVLDNVKLSLTLSNKNTSDMEDKAINALERVGLKDHIYKKPSELSGGQMQRVAIARALVNDPQILLADEPTGALDSKTSIEIMNLLKEIAKDKLVIMVTHNRGLAEKYSTRIIGIKDGKIISDTDPYETSDRADNFKISKIALKLKTALGLSFNNLLNKKSRTILTAFAGSIGIIGIALILSISNGASDFIEENQKNALKSYPIDIEKTSIDLSSLSQMENTSEKTSEDNKLVSNDIGLKNRSKLSGTGLENDLESFKSYLENNDVKLDEEIGNHFISYSYDGKFDIFTKDPKNEIVNTDGSDFEPTGPAGFNFLPGFGNSNQNPNFSQLISTKDGKISNLITDEYEIVEGKWPEAADELVLFTDYNNQILRSKFYELGFLPKKEYEDILADLDNNEKVDIKNVKLDLTDIIGKEYQILTPSDYYEKDGENFVNIKDDRSKVDEKIKNAKTLKIVGIAKKIKDDDNRVVTSPLAYTQDFTKEMISYVEGQEIIKNQLADKDTNVLNGLKFRASNDEEKINQTKDFLNNLSDKNLLGVNAWIMQNREDLVEKLQEESKKLAMAGMASSGANLGPDANSNDRQLVAFLLKENDKDTLLDIYDEFLRDFSYKKNLEELGFITEDTPSKISIYVDNFENRDKVKAFIDEYNQGKTIENQISYTDLIGIISKSITDIIGAISYILIAFVAVSLIVSSIMIGIITYISVFERTKEIGILRAIGASKKDIYKVFMAETLIIGLLSGLIGVGLTYILNIFITRIMVNMSGFADIGASLPAGAAVVLILISVGLSLLAGLIPSRIAAKKDPVEALSAD